MIDWGEFFYWWFVVGLGGAVSLIYFIHTDDSDPSAQSLIKTREGFVGAILVCVVLGYFSGLIIIGVVLDFIFGKDGW